MHIAEWYKISSKEWFNDWNSKNKYSKLLRASPHGGLIAVITFGEGVSRRLHVFSGTGTLLVSFQWAVKWILDAGWTRALQFVTILSNGVVRVCTLSSKRRHQFTLLFKPIAGKVFEDGFFLFETNGTVHFIGYNNLECKTDDRIRCFGQLHFNQGDIPIAIVTRRVTNTSRDTTGLDLPEHFYFALTTSYRCLFVCKTRNRLKSLQFLTRDLGFVVKDGLLDFYDSLIGVTSEDELVLYKIDPDKFDEIIPYNTVKLETIPTSIYLTAAFILINTPEQVYLLSGNSSLWEPRFPPPSSIGGGLLGLKAGSSDRGGGEVYSEEQTRHRHGSWTQVNFQGRSGREVGAPPTGDPEEQDIEVGVMSTSGGVGGAREGHFAHSSECYIIGFYSSPNLHNIYIDKGDEYEEGVRLLYPYLGQVCLIRSCMDWYNQILNNPDNSSYRLLQAYKSFSGNSSQAFTLEINFGEAIYGCINAAAATLDPSLSQAYLEAAALGRRLNGFNEISNIGSFASSFYTSAKTRSEPQSNEVKVDINKLWAVTCGWLRIIHTLSTYLDQYLTVTEGNFIGIERLCEMISARGHFKIALAVSKFSNCSPSLAYYQFAVSELLESSQQLDSEIMSKVFSYQLNDIPNGLFARLAKVAASPPFSRNALALSFFDREPCIYSKAALVNIVCKGETNIGLFPTDLIRVMIEADMQLPLYHRHYKSGNKLKKCQKILERLGSNNEAAINASIIGYNCKERGKEAKNWFNYSQNFTKASKNNLLHQSIDEMMILLKHKREDSSLTALLFDLFMNNSHTTAMDIAGKFDVAPKRLGICLLATCILRKDLHLVNKYMKDKRIEFPQDLLQEAYGFVGVESHTGDSGILQYIWK